MRQSRDANGRFSKAPGAISNRTQSDIFYAVARGYRKDGNEEMAKQFIRAARIARGKPAYTDKELREIRKHL